jgi:hypothetical protein
MQTAFDSLPENARNFLKKIFGIENPPIFSFFCENWGSKPELPTAEMYLKDYALLAMLEDKIVKFPIGWYERASFGDQSLLRDIQFFSYDEIEECRLEKFMQTCNIFLKVKDKEIRIEKCLPPHADRFLQIFRAKKEKQGGSETQKLEMIYPVSAGTPISFQVKDDDSLWIMFMKSPTNNRGPSEFNILVYKDRLLVKLYHFEPRQ